MDAVNTQIELTDAERIDRLRLIRSDNVGPRTFRSLLTHCGSAREAISRLPELARRGGGARLRICSEDEARAELAGPAKGTASACSRRAKPAIRRALPPSRMRRPCSRYAARPRR